MARTGYMHDRFTLFPQHTGLCLWTAHKVKQTVENGWRYDIYWSASSSRHFLRFLSNIFKKQTRSLCFTPLLFGMTQNAFPRVIIISPFLKTIYNKVAVHLYVFTFVETIFNLKNGVLLIQLTSELHTNILIITRGSQEPETLNWISWATTIV
jgi:hypothetical protein